MRAVQDPRETQIMTAVESPMAVVAFGPVSVLVSDRREMMRNRARIASAMTAIRVMVSDFGFIILS